MPASKAGLLIQKELSAGDEFAGPSALPGSWHLLSTPPENPPSPAGSRLCKQLLTSVLLRAATARERSKSIVFHIELSRPNEFCQVSFLLSAIRQNSLAK